MDQNVGGTDRLARLVVGPLLVLVAVVSLAGLYPLGPVVEGVALVVGAVLAVTGAVRKCPLNAAFGVDTSGR
ncbi:MAG: DUF2892 domain-containing protein [Halobacteriaceae archaeon]